MLECPGLAAHRCRDRAASDLCKADGDGAPAWSRGQPFAYALPADALAGKDADAPQPLRQRWTAHAHAVHQLRRCLERFHSRARL